MMFDCRVFPGCPRWLHRQLRQCAAKVHPAKGAPIRLPPPVLISFMLARAPCSHHEFRPSFFGAQMEQESEATRPHLLKKPQFWVVFSLYVVDAVVNFAAYSYAPLSVVSPISGCVIIFNAGLANRIFGERLGLRDLIGSVLILLGGSVAVVTGSRQLCRVFSSPSCDDESSNVCFLPCSRRRLIAPPRSSRRCGRARRSSSSPRSKWLCSSPCLRLREHSGLSGAASSIGAFNCEITRNQRPARRLLVVSEVDAPVC